MNHRKREKEMGAREVEERKANAARDRSGERGKGASLKRPNALNAKGEKKVNDQ